MSYLRQSGFLALLAIANAVPFIGPASADAGAQRTVDHRNDYKMESISGGDFREYVSTHVAEDDRWARSMRTFGSFHNHMHELMTRMARHAVEERGDRDRVPEFANRISGGEWTRYREVIEKAGDESAWFDLVRVTEIMHDRVHHAMARSLIRDRESRSREVNLGDFLRGDPLDQGEGIPGEGERRISMVSLDEFRELAWRHETESRYLHEMVQSMNVFALLLDDLLTQWLVHGETLASEACRSAPDSTSRRGEGWPDYVSSISGCEDAEWHEFAKVAGLMRDRIHHMMYKMTVYSRRQG